MTTSAIDLEKVFKAGVAAYREGDYEQAIALLNRLTRLGSRTYWLKASMGLVQVYTAQQRWADARAQCQEILQKTSMPAPQTWAETTLLSIDRQVAEATAAASDSATNKDQSGFRPIEPDSQVIRPNSQAIKRSISHFRTVDPLSEPRSVSKEPNALAAPDEISELQVSMFHYTYLNDEAERTAIGTKSTTEPGTANESYLWTYGDRLPRGRSLGRARQGAIRIAQLGSAIAIYFLLRLLIHRLVALVNSCLAFLDRILPFWIHALPGVFRDVTWPLLIVLLAITIASPWLWDLILRLFADRQKFSISQLRAHSPESASVISRYCRGRRWSLPTLWTLPTDIPLLFSYGWLPRNARLIVSKGLLSELREDEIAALCAYELSHWSSWHWPLLSIHGLFLQILHQTYWQLVLWGNMQKPPLKWTAGIAANFSYGLFWLVRLPGLWVARVRTYYGDRTATEITGNPNALIRGLAKLSFGLAASVERQGYTPNWVESLGLLMPVQADLARQSLYGHWPLSELFAWDSKNPLRNWMDFLDSHPPLGDRLCAIAAYAKHWKLTPEIAFATSSRIKGGLSKQNWQRLLRQGTPYLGLVIGATIGTALWGIGAIASLVEWPVFDWMHRDIGLFQCCLLLGVGIGSLLRINCFFPDLSLSMSLSDALPEWVCHPGLLPVDGLPTKLTGTILGRPGIANWLGQDLYLRSPFGLVKLHFFSITGPLGNLLNRSKTPRMLQGESVQVLGWFRRGAQPWLDVDKIRLGNGRLLTAGHPLYSLMIAAVATGLGLWLLLKSTGHTG
ncbi:MAG: zinc metalloprotease HtpX [Cyanobacteria bacterium P01_D01_bin.1]